RNLTEAELDGLVSVRAVPSLTRLLERERMQGHHSRRSFPLARCTARNRTDRSISLAGSSSGWKKSARETRTLGTLTDAPGATVTRGEQRNPFVSASKHRGGVANGQ